MDIYKIYSDKVTNKIKELTKDLGVKFEVKIKDKDGFNDVLVRIQNDTLTKENDKDFFAKVNEVILGTYAYDIRFTYVKNIK